MSKKVEKRHISPVALREDRILKATKAMIASNNLEKITVREVAKLAGVTTPTLYNRFGSKDALIGAALDDFYNAEVTAALQGLEELKKDVYLQIFEIAALYTRACLQQPQFIRALMAMHFKVDQSSSVQNVYQDNCMTFGRILTVMENVRELRSNVNIPLLASLLTDNCYLVALYWCQGRIFDNQLKDSMTRNCAVALCNFVRPGIGKLLQQRVDALSATA